MVWQPAEGGEAVSASEWSRVVAGDDGAATGPDPQKPDETVGAESTSESSTDASASTGSPAEPISVDAAAAEATDGVESEEGPA